jgi:hypothetical protein
VERLTMQRPFGRDNLVVEADITKFFDDAS